MKKVKIAVIGVGNIAESHIEAYQANPNVELHAFCDINKERLEEKGARFGITRLYTDEAQKRAFILGYLTRDAFFDCDIQVKKMSRPNKSEKAVYFAKSLSFAEAIEHLK